jgi:putative ABC transport system substrate-binding protein
MRRREFITLLGGSAVTWPVVAHSQQREGMRRVGVLMSYAEADLDAHGLAKVLKQELERLGWTEINLHVDFRWSADNLELLSVNVKEMIALRPDVIVTTNNQTTGIVAQQTRIIPVVFANAGDPLGTGLVASMAHPGSNVTGFAGYEPELAGKWIQLLIEMAPGTRRLAAVHPPSGPSSMAQLRMIEAAAASSVIQLIAIPATNSEQIQQSLDAFARETNGALIILAGPATAVHRELIIERAARFRLPAMYPNRSFIEVGGLMSYRSEIREQYRRAASYVDRILRGEKPGELPVQLPTKYELVLNLKTARMLGLTVPPTLLALADEVIE